MKAAVWYGENDVRVEEIKKPSIKEGEVLIKVRAAGICGTDLTIYKGKFPRSRPPLIPGHEFAGEVVAVKNVPSHLKIGDRVVVNPLLFCGRCIACKMGFSNACPKLRLIGVDIDGAFAEFVKASWEKVHKIPSNFPFETAALIEPVAVALHAVKKSTCGIGDLIMVMGAGPIGILVAMIARIAGASQVIVTEVLEYRVKLAKKLGFCVIDSSKSNVVEKVCEMTKGRGVDVVFDTAAVPQVASQLVSLIRPRGKIVIIGLYKEPSPVDLLDMIFKEAHLLGSRVYSEIDFEKAADLVTSGKIKIESLITHRLSLKEVKEGIKLLEKGKNVMKVVVFP